MKVRRKWRIKQTMVVPAQWQGSVEHFYHFFFGYFMPTVLWQEKTNASQFTVRDCGPMNPWFSLLRPDTRLEFMPPGVMLQRVLTRRQEMVVVRGWDDPTRFHNRSLEIFTTIIKDRVLKDACQQSDSEARITVLERAPSPDFYLKPDSETYSSGAAWRSLPNVRPIAAALSELGTVTLVDTAILSPEEQVRLMSQTDLLVAQHGAGLSNIVWLPAGASVVEVKPPLDPTVARIFESLAAARRIKYAAVDQESEHSSVEEGLVSAAARALLDAPNGHIPQPPGRWPVRILRQLPRRW